MTGFTQVTNKIDLSDLALLIGKNGKDTQEVINTLIKMIEILASRKEQEIPKPEVSVNLDVERIIKAMPKPERPIVNMDTEGLRDAITTKPEAPRSFVFDIKRDGHGRIKQVIANPVGTDL